MTPYLAFPSGAITYDCPPCGQCCRGLGIADPPEHLLSSPDLVGLGAFVTSERLDGPLVTLYTYADGCRHLEQKDNLCGLHRRDGPAAKPLICRLFPFSRLVDLDGMWAVLPHGDCPWTAAEQDGGGALSRHEQILEELSVPLLEHLTPVKITPYESMPAAERRALEQRVRDRLSLEESLDETLAAVAEVHAQRTGNVIPPPADPTLWLDLLRSAGEPPPLSDANRRLFIATIPTLRLLLSERVPLAAVPVALQAFALWVRTLAELAPRQLTGRDLLALFDGAIGPVRILAYAEQAIPPIDDPAMFGEGLLPLTAELIAHVGEPLGEVLLRTLRHHEHGALSILTRLGAAL